jgi:hypothetical protein
MRVLTRSSLVPFAFAIAATSMVADARSQAQTGTSQVIVRAVNRDGRPVLDLKAGDVSVRVDGADREVKALELVRPAEGNAAPAAPTPAPAPASNLPPPYAINAGGESGPGGGRELLLLVDDEGIAPGREEPVRQSITTLVGALTPSDRVGLMAMKQGGLNVPPTTQHAAVLSALPKIIAIGSTSETANSLACRTKVMLGTLGGLLRAAPPQRTIVLFSPGMATVSADTMRTGGSASNAGDTSLCQIRSNDLEELTRTAATSPAELFVVYHSEGMANSANLSSGQAGLENVTGTSGGEMLRLTGAGEIAAKRIADSAGYYYLATLEGTSNAPARRVDARVSRDGLRVSARPMMAAPATATGKAGTPRDMIRVATVYREVVVRAAGFVSRQAGAADLKVVALFEPDDPSVKLTAAMVGLFDEKGSLKAQWTAQPNELSRSPIVAALTAAPGKYRVRVAATDVSGKGGTTDFDLAVQLPDAPPVKTSTMLLGVGQGGFAPKLAFTSSDAAAIGLIEIYNVPKEAKVETTFEILKGDEVMGSGQGTVGAGPGEDARLAYGGFGVATLEPGDYTMRATVNIDGKPAGTTTRTLRKLK